VEWRGKQLTVQQIRNQPGHDRVGVPERMVAYVNGTAKKTRIGEPNTLRQISQDDVERFSRVQPCKKKGYGSRNVPHRLNKEERAEPERAARKSFATFAGTGNRRTRRGSPLANIHQQWCDGRDTDSGFQSYWRTASKSPTGSWSVSASAVRTVWGSVQVDDFMARWQTQILGAAFSAGHEGLVEDLEEDDDNLDDEFSPPDYVAALDFNALREAWATVGNGSESASKEWRRALPIILLTAKIKLS
jgi:hypothetical protein